MSARNCPSRRATPDRRSLHNTLKTHGSRWRRRSRSRSSTGDTPSEFAEESLSGSLKSGRDSLLRRFKTADCENVAREVVAIFTAEFLKELDDKSPLSAAIEGYQRDLACLVETAAPDIATWLQPEIKTVDLGSVEA